MFDCCFIFVIKWASACSKLIRHHLRRCGVITHRRSCLLLLVCCQQVAEQGITPEMAIPVCNNLRITSSILSRKITKPVAERANEAVARILQKLTADAAGSLVTLSTGEGRGEWRGASGSVMQSLVTTSQTKFHPSQMRHTTTHTTAAPRGHSRDLAIWRPT